MRVLFQNIIQCNINFFYTIFVSSQRTQRDSIIVSCKQVGTATTVPIICVGGHASAVALVGFGGPGELQGRPPRLQMSPVPSSRLFIWSMLSRAVPTCAHSRGWTDYCTSHELKQRHWVHEGSTTPRLPAWNSLPVDLRDPGLSLHSFRTKLKSHFFIVYWFFSVFIYVLYYCL